MNKQKVFAITVAAIFGGIAFTTCYYTLGVVLDPETIKNIVKKFWR